MQRETTLRSERDARRDYDWATQRGWKVVNPNRLNAYGDPVAYKLVPDGVRAVDVPARCADVRASPGRSGTQLWVTAHADDERWPCGRYPTQSTGDEGLPAWTAADRPLENTDVVLWYVFGIHHVTRVEDWPVMPVDTVSFWLKPFGFFDRNPALDVAPSRAHCLAEPSAEGGGLGPERPR